MSGLSHSTNQNRFPVLKLVEHAIPAAWPFVRGGRAAVNTDVQVIPEGERLPASRRLVVILPDAAPDVFSLPRRIWNLAAPDCRQVLLLSKPNGEENEFYSRVNLTTLAACIRDARVSVQIQQVLGTSLEQAVRQYVQPGDVLVCFAEHQVRGFWKKERLADALARSTRLPVYTLEGPVVEVKHPLSAHLIDFLILFVCLATLAAFFVLEAWIDQNTVGTSRMMLEFLTVVVEGWAVAVCVTRPFRL